MRRVIKFNGGTWRSCRNGCTFRRVDAVWLPTGRNGCERATPYVVRICDGCKDIYPRCVFHAAYPEGQMDTYLPAHVQLRERMAQCKP